MRSSWRESETCWDGEIMEQEARAGREEKVWDRGDDGAGSPCWPGGERLDQRSSVCSVCVCVCVKRLVVNSRPCDGQRMGIPRGDWHMARQLGKRGARRLGAWIFREGRGVMRGGHSLKAILCRWWRL